LISESGSPTSRSHSSIASLGATAVTSLSGSKILGGTPTVTKNGTSKSHYHQVEGCTKALKKNKQVTLLSVLKICKKWNWTCVWIYDSKICLWTI